MVDPSVSGAAYYRSKLTREQLLVAEELSKHEVCWRCCFMILQISECFFYRQLPGSDDQPVTCQVCQGVLAQAEAYVPYIQRMVHEQNYEFSDFKMTFAIQLRGHLMRYLVCSKVE